MNSLKKLIKKTLHIGISTDDNEAIKLKKISINMVPVIISPLAVFWGMIYFSLGYQAQALIPLFYALTSAINLFAFHKNKNLQMMQKTQMSLILILPFCLMWSLGGFTQSSYIFIWAFFAPIVALIHERSSKALYWLYSFIALVIFSTIIDQWLIANCTKHLPTTILELFFLLNISAALSGIYFLIKYFIDESHRDAAQKLGDNISYLESYKSNIDNNLIVTRTNVNGIITFANSNFFKTTGFNENEVIGKSHSIIRHPRTSKKTFEELWNTILSKKTWHGTIQNMRKDGTSYWIDTTISPILNKDGEIVEFIAIRHNISKLIEQQDKLIDMLYIDDLTQLKNRNALLDSIKNMQKLSCMLINIDGFSQINNLYGEDFGNEVLKEFAKFLALEIEHIDHANLYRQSGDEFIITCIERNKEMIIGVATNLILHNNDNILTIRNQQISLNITIGISLEENLSLLSTAHMALIAAKRESKTLVVYSDKLSLSTEYENNIKWIQEIKDAIFEDRIIVYFQPIVDNSNNTISKYETLIRLIDKEGQIITPFHFLDIAKKAKLYKQLTKIVIKKSFEVFKKTDYEFSINITIEDILDKDITDYIIRTLEQYNISNRVVFEIVESESISNFDKIEEFINVVKSYGCRISIDDFGTGYSNFEHLMRLQADFIKIDGSIIKEITHDKRSALITSVIVAFAKEMNIETIGEYVENKEINDKLISLGVNKSQGYYFDMPQATLKGKDVLEQ